MWFIVALCALLVLGLLGYLLYRCCRYLSTKDCSCCEPRHIHDEDQLIQDKAPPKKEILLEMTQINTVFDGEEVDPVTKRVYEYNSKSGARRWKDAIIVSKPVLNQPESSTLVISRRPANPEAPANSEQPLVRERGETAGSGQSQRRMKCLSSMSTSNESVSLKDKKQFHKTKSSDMSEV
ncbi:cadherin-related family member 3-like [Myxocyprinus asiaticus]|uniref:cadherin-related family member 3-like n=1 Tax=Myxocyprinus asiaticus TaxID=70543 RepID=UPI002221C144|nr:cadherin-related family member 3-like [Myxocyprinus asiaticus]